MKLDMHGFIQKAGPLRALAVVVSRHGEEVGRHAWDDLCRRNVYSASKSFTSAAVGIAQKEGLLSLDEKLTEAFPEELPKEVSPNLAKATVRDLLTMCLGQPESFLMGGDRPLHQEKNWVKLSLAQPFTDEPGTRFLYNNVGPYLAGVLVQRRAGCDLLRYLGPRLLWPIGITTTTWETDPMGYTFGAGGMFLTPDELHRFGLLCLQKGRWQGRQLVPQAYLEEATQKQVENGGQGYGYLFWRGAQGSYRADGKYGQFSIVMEDQDAVVTITAECRQANQLLDAVFEEIYPQL